jgi:peptide/nickel transport system substrate-binding protein
MRFRRSKAVVAVVAASALALAACASERDDDETGEDFDRDAILIFGTAGETASLDPTFVSDGESIRVARHIFDTLLQIRQGTTEIEPGLALDWDSDEAGTTWTFELREGVNFHDGEPFNAAAVCANFDRWHNLTGAAQDPGRTYYWRTLMGGFAENEPDSGAGEPNFAGCDATGEYTAVISLNKVTSKFPRLLSLPTFAMHSPAALEQYNASDLGPWGEFEWSEYAEGHPTGTGPFKFVQWDRGNQEVHLERNDDYWGGTADVAGIVFKAIPDETQRVEQLLAGEIHGFDLPAPAHWPRLEAEGMNLLVRDIPVNILYVAFTQSSNEALQDLDVRRAIAHALNREGLVNALMPEGATVATQFQPPSLPGYADDVTTYEYDPDLARQLLADAGYDEDNPLRLTFYWPTEVTRPYMPTPRDMIELFQPDLEAVGIEVDPVSLVWGTEYIPAVIGQGEGDLHFLGWTGDYPDAYNFIGTWFARENPEWGFDYPELFAKMAEADQTADEDERVALYQELNRLIMEFLPGVPVSHMPNGIVFAPNVEGVVQGPLAAERLDTARIMIE